MSLTKSKIIVYGPFDIDFITGASSALAISGLKPDSITLNVETKLGNAVFEDGDEEDWEEGRKLAGELLISELDTADHALIEGSDNLTVTQQNGKVITIPATCRMFASVEGGKTKVSILKTTALGNALSDILSIA